MGSGRSGLYPSLGTNGNAGGSGGVSEGPVNGKDYNSAKSKSIKKVDSVSTAKDLHTVPAHGTPNSVSKNYKDGKLDSERYYDSHGNAYLDIDYTDHGNPKTHPNVPHEHSITFDEDGKLKRAKENKIK